MGLHVSDQKSFFDELLRAVEAFELSFCCMSPDMIVALVLVLEEHTANVTSELLDVGVLQMMDLQALIRPELVAANFATKLLLVVHHKMRSLRGFVGECFVTAWEGAAKRARDVFAVKVEQLVLLKVADGAERLLAIRKIAFELLASVDSDV